MCAFYVGKGAQPDSVPEAGIDIECFQRRLVQKRSRASQKQGASRGNQIGPYEIHGSGGKPRCGGGRGESAGSVNGSGGARIKGRGRILKAVVETGSLNFRSRDIHRRVEVNRVDIDRDVSQAETGHVDPVGA